MQTNTETTSSTDNFAAAFDLLARDEPVPASAPAEAPSETPQEPAEAAAPEPAPADGAPAPQAPPATAPEAGAGLEDKPQEAAPAAQPAPEPAKQDDELLQRFAEIVRTAAEKPQPAPQPAPAPAQPPPQEEPIYTQEEAEFLRSYEQDWGDVSKAESLKRRAEYRALVQHVFAEVAKHYNPYIETIEALSQHTQISALESQVSDYNDVRDKVIDWAKQQPAYLQAAYNHVINHGTVDEVVDLINRWRAETGTTLQTQPAPAPAPKPTTELPAAAKQAAIALAPVSSKRSAVPQTVDNGDFDAAFAAFADKV